MFRTAACNENSLLTCDSEWRLSLSNMHNIENNDFGSDLDRDLSGPVFSSPQNIPNPNTTLLTLEENPSLTRSSTSSMQAEEKCTVSS